MARFWSVNENVCKAKKKSSEVCLSNVECLTEVGLSCTSGTCQCPLP